MSSVSLCTQVEAVGDANKVAASPPQGGVLQAQFHFVPRLRPWVTQIRLSLHHLGEVAYELNFSLYQVEVVGDANKVAASPPRGGGL